MLAGLVAVDFDEKFQCIVVLNDGDGLIVEFFEAGFESREILVVLTRAAVIEGLGGLKAFFGFSFADIEDNSGFDWMTGTGGDGHDLVFFAVPATDGGENEGIAEKVMTFEKWQYPFVEDVGGG